MKKNNVENSKKLLGSTSISKKNKKEVHNFKEAMHVDNNNNIDQIQVRLKDGNIILLPISAVEQTIQSQYLLHNPQAIGSMCAYFRGHQKNNNKDKDCRNGNKCKWIHIKIDIYDKLINVKYNHLKNDIE